MITLAEVSSLCSALTEQRRKVDQIEEELSTVKEFVRRLEEEDIPLAMQELGVDELKLVTGEKVSIKHDVYASLTSESKPAAYNWLEANGFGGLIKTNVSVEFGKGQIEGAESLAEDLQSRGLPVSLGRDVHAQTLKAFLREQLANGSNVPLELFNARPISKAKIS
jgi:hypothetical protein